MNKTVCSIFSLMLICSLVKGQDQYQLISHGSSNFIQIENVRLQFKCDSEFIYTYLKYWNGIGSKNPRIIDTADCSPYNSELIVYESKKLSDYLIFWVIENEYASEIHTFYLAKNNLSKIGGLPVLKSCETCENLMYPIEWISVSGGKDEIIIRLLEPFKYDLGNDNSKKYLPNELYFKIDKLNKKLKTIKLDSLVN